MVYNTFDEFSLHCSRVCDEVLRFSLVAQTLARAPEAANHPQVPILSQQGKYECMNKKDDLSEKNTSSAE